ncbi:MAG: helicase-related protein [Gemmatimonadaceae bacterium]
MENNRTLNIVSVAVARHAIARCVLGEDAAHDIHLGAITLYPHQTSAAHRIQRALRDYGGALLCDTVGLGKTYTALAAAEPYPKPLIIAPAALGSMWHRALDATITSADFVSFEALSRGKIIECSYPLVIVDEAHHLRNPATKRYAEVARLCIRAPVLLISATPIHNSRADLTSLAALFMGHRAYTLGATELSRLVVRRSTVSRVPDPTGLTGLTGPTIPRVDHAPSRVIATDDSVVDRIVALPPSVPPADGGIAAALVTQGLARQWVSSNAALLAAVKRRIARSLALIAALDAGRYPTRAELESWVYSDDTLQLAFPELLPSSDFIAPELHECVTAHLEGLRLLASHVLNTRGDSEQRADFMLEVIAAHPGEKVVVFTSYKETAAAVYRSLIQIGGVALMTSAGGTVAGGTLTRQETLERFAPEACSARKPRARDDIRVLITTDLLSEGVNLQDACVVVHLDLPWTAARLEQRIGRVARLGSRHRVVTSYALHPSERAEAMLSAVGTVERKARVAHRVFGVGAGSMHGRHSPGAGYVEFAESIRVILQQWLAGEQGDMESPIEAIQTPVIAAMSSKSSGAIVACIVDGTPTLATIGELLDVSTDVSAVSTALALGMGNDEHVPRAFADLTRAALELWYERERAAVDAGLGSGATGVAADRRTRAAIRMADAASRARPFADRGQAAVRASTLRRYASTPMPIALERLVYSGSYECLQQAAESPPLPNAGRSSGGEVRLSIVAIILLLGNSCP